MPNWRTGHYWPDELFTFTSQAKRSDPRLGVERHPEQNREV